MAYQPKSYKKFVATAATATLVATAVVPAAFAAEVKPAAFTDVAKQYEAAVNFVVSNNIAKGLTETTFGVSAQIKRGDAAIMIANAAGLNDETAPASGFSDVPTRGVLAINSLKKAGVVNGKSATNFGFNDSITRGEAAIMFANAFKLTGDTKDVKFTDVNDRYMAAVAALVKEGVTNGISATQFGTTNNIKRGDFARFVYALEGYIVDIEGQKPEITNVSAINATTARVNFKGALPAGADFNNFEINGGLVVTDAVVSADRKSATLTFNRELTRNQEYTVTVTGLKDAEGKTYEDTSSKFTWTVAEGVTVALENTTLEQGQVTGLTVKDAGGKLVNDATVEVRSYNANLVTATSGQQSPEDVKLTAQALAGTTDIEVITTLPDGTVLTNTFKVTVKEAVTSIANKGYTFVPTADLGNYEYDNTKAFSLFGASDTDLVVGETSNLVAFTETNNNADADPIDFAGATVRTSNGVVATAVIDANDRLVVTGNAAGTATLTVTLNDANKTKKTFAVTVTAEPKLTDVSVDATSVKLSDESSAGTEGVTEQTVTVTSLDQFKDEIAFGTAGKVTVATSTNGLTLGGLTTDAVTNLDNELVFGAGADDASFTIGSTLDTPITNGKVTVNYFAKTTDTKPTSTKTINVNVVDVDATVTPSDIDVVAPATAIDANAKNTSITDFDAIDFSGSDAYYLDAKGNRIGEAPINTVNLATTSANNDYVNVTGTSLIFDTNDDGVADIAEVLTYGRNIASTVNVEVSDGNIVKPIAVKYQNSAVLPNVATVATAPVSIKIPTTASISIEEILFGAVDPANADKQLLTDTINGVADSVYGISATAKNAGYALNKPVVSFTGTDGKALKTGTSLYGSTLTELGTSANLWNNSFDASIMAEDFVVDGFAVDFDITNVVKTTAATLADTGSLGDSVTLPSVTDYATFTVVIKGIYIEGADQDVAANNLLKAPTQLNVNVSAK